MNSMNNTNSYYGFCGFLSGGIFIFLLSQYKIINLEKRIKELDETNTNLIEHLMLLDSTPCKSSYKKIDKADKADEPNNDYHNYKTHFEDDITE